MTEQQPCGGYLIPTEYHEMVRLLGVPGIIMIDSDGYLVLKIKPSGDAQFILLRKVLEKIIEENRKGE
jgi:hypothetical protein